MGVETSRRVQQAAVFFLFTVVALELPLVGASPARKRNCTTSCGGIKFEYPFGVEMGCYRPGFNLTCRNGSRLFMGDGTVEVLEISIPESTVRVNSTVMAFDQADVKRGNATSTWRVGVGVGGPFFVSELNMITLIGCNARFDLRLLPTGGGDAGVGTLVSSCTAVCPPIGTDDAATVTFYNDTCSGVGCCQACLIQSFSLALSIQNYLKFNILANIVLAYPSYTIQINDIHEKTAPNMTQYTNSAYITDRPLNYSRYRLESPASLPAVLDWVITNSSRCPAPPPTSSSTTETVTAPECRSANSYCSDYYGGINDLLGYRCHCSQGYHGNPYVLGGCRDVDECHTPGYCYGDCENTEGGYHCRCPAGLKGNPSIPNGCEGLSIGLGVSGGLCTLILALAAPFITNKIKLHKVMKMKRRYFKQNHGLLLQQLMSQKANIGERMIFTLQELEKATDNFDKTREVGGGGHGIVYKGILDLHVVAIKRSRIVVQREIDDFINEVAILSQVNHRNVVKLLGCCLEAEVPLLVYEFISNGSLNDHLHVKGPISLSWDDRIRIALEIARALVYLHSATTVPIFHRDIKASNVLLDDNLTAKISDFGASRYIPVDQTGLTTAVQGTIGYLDPMYYYTGRLTDKSDVFSFGVLLIEILTRKKPIYRTDDGDSLVLHFASQLREEKFFEIIDHQVMEEGDGEIKEVAELAAICTKLNGEDRPTMREVEMTLENLRVKRKPVIHNKKPRSADASQIARRCMSNIGDTEEVISRQYSFEDEMLLSERYPR
uniref:Protein kinase domain-containing protein n=1 Tax=Leersia perrieri TaxID=77586 RepID=A0A0D9XZ97_9ORYZ